MLKRLIVISILTTIELLNLAYVFSNQGWSGVLFNLLLIALGGVLGFIGAVIAAWLMRG